MGAKIRFLMATYKPWNANSRFFHTFSVKIFGAYQKMPYICNRNFGLWCNGNTADSGPAFPGSSPGSPTKKEPHTIVWGFLD